MTLTAPGEYVTIKNAGDTDYTYMCLGTAHTIQAGESRTVAWVHLAHLMGDPFLTNSDRNMEREAEYLRIITLNGREGGEKNFPKLEAYDADGDRIVTIMEDREGTNAPAASASDMLDPVQLRAQLDQMARRQAALEDLLRVHERATPNESITTPEDPPPPVQSEPRPDIKGLEPVETVVSDGTIPEDTPKKVPVRRRRSSA